MVKVKIYTTNTCHYCDMAKKYMSQDIYDAGVSTIGYLHSENLMSISEAIIKLKHDHYEPYIIDDGV